MSSRTVTIRIDPDNDAGKIFERWEAEGYKPRQIFETALLCLEGVPVEPPVEMNDTALIQLQRIVGRLETVVQSIQQNGGVMTDQHLAVIDDALGGQFVQGMSRLVRPGFTKPPSEE